MIAHIAALALAAALLAPQASAQEDEVDRVLRQSCSSDAASVESSGTALFALSEAATEKQRSRANTFLRAAHDAMLMTPDDFPVVPYMESLKAQPRFDALIGIANGNLRTANRVGGDTAQTYDGRATCMFRLARAFDAARPPSGDDPQHDEVLHSIDRALGCIADRAKANGATPSQCHEALDLSLPPALLERKLKSN